MNEMLDVDYTAIFKQVGIDENQYPEYTTADKFALDLEAQSSYQKSLTTSDTVQVPSGWFQSLLNA